MIQRNLGRRGALYGLLAATVAIAGGCAPHPAYSYRYRYTITVDDNGIARSGSSVVEVTERQLTGGIDTQYGATLKGQATLVDMGRGRWLVGAIDRPTTLLLEFYNMPAWTPANLTSLAAQRSVVPVSPDQVVQLVTFGDNRKPSTAKGVDPMKLDVAFGPGVTLKSVTIQVTTDPITTGITHVFPWLRGEHGYIDHANSSDRSVGFLADQFVRGVS